MKIERVLVSSVFLVILAVGMASAERSETDLTGVTADESADQVGDYMLAEKLIAYGRKRRAPHALVAAAEIAGNVRFTGQLSARPDTIGVPDLGPVKQGIVDPFAILDEAVALSNNDQSIGRIAGRVRNSLRLTSQTRGAYDGPKWAAKALAGGGTAVYEIIFQAGELARVVVKGDGYSDLDLFVYDENGYEITVDDDYSEICLAEWVPRRTRLYYVKVVNVGKARSEFVLISN